MSSEKLTRARIAELLDVYARPLSDLEMDRVETYLALLVRWNGRVNLTAIRDPREIVQRHFGESFFLEQHLGQCTSLLDFGSGAGFPGMPVQIRRPYLAVTLAESQPKKAAFLREVVRALGLNTEVWASAVAMMDGERRFQAICLRAVDRPEVARAEALSRLAGEGTLLELVGEGDQVGGVQFEVPNSQRRSLRISGLFHVEQDELSSQALHVGHSVPHGTLVADQSESQ